MHNLIGNFTRCIECCETGIELAAQLGSLPAQFPTYKSLALAKLGRYGEAWESLQQEVADAAHPFGSAFKYYGTGRYFLDVLAYDRAVATFQDMLDSDMFIGRAWLKLDTQIHMLKALIGGDCFEANRVAAITGALGDSPQGVPPELQAGKNAVLVNWAERSVWRI